MTKMYLCRRCGGEFPGYKMARDCQLKEGISVYCKECKKIKVREWNRNSMIRQGEAKEGTKIDTLFYLLLTPTWSPQCPHFSPPSRTLMALYVACPH